MDHYIPDTSQTVEMGRSEAAFRGTPRRLVLEGKIVHVFFMVCALVSIATTVGIVVSLLSQALGFFKDVSIFDFLFGTSWAPILKPRSYGVLPLVGGTLLVAGIAACVAVPVGIATAIFLSEYAPDKVRRVIKPVLEILAGIPTVVYGYFALTFVTPVLQHIFPDLIVFNALSAGLVMGLMIIPMVSSLSEDAMITVPRSLREGAYALGATRLEVSLRVVVPAALSGIIAAFILGISRAIGETMLVTIAAGATPNLTINPLESIQTMTAYIVQLSLGEASQGSLEYQTIFAVGLLLFLMTLTMNVLGHWIVRRWSEHDVLEQAVETTERAPEMPTQSGAAISESIGTSALAKAIPGSRDRYEPTLAFKPKLTFRKSTGSVFHVLFVLAVLVGIAGLITLMVQVLKEGLPWLTWDFVSNYPSRFPERAGVKSALMGTIWLMGLTAAFTVPVGVGAAVYLEEYAPKNWLTRLIEVNISNLAGVPSIVYGLLGLGVFVQWLSLGRSLLAGALTLSLLVLPIVILASREAIRAVPRSQREAAYALGATKWQVIKGVVLPGGTPGVLTGVILAMSRAIGEAAPVIAISALVFITFIPTDPLDRFTVLPIQIFNWATLPRDEFRGLAAAGIIVLLAILLSMNAIAVFLRNHFQVRSEE